MQEVNKIVCRIRFAGTQYVSLSELMCMKTTYMFVGFDGQEDNILVCRI